MPKGYHDERWLTFDATGWNLNHKRLKYVSLFEILARLWCCMQQKSVCLRSDRWKDKPWVVLGVTKRQLGPPEDGVLVFLRHWVITLTWWNHVLDLDSFVCTQHNTGTERMIYPPAWIKHLPETCNVLSLIIYLSSMQRLSWWCHMP